MQKTTILFLILLVLSCRHKKIAKIWEFPKVPNAEAFFFSYGVKPDTEVEVNTEKPPVWGPSLKITEKENCIYSQDEFFRSKEYGPTLGICIEASSENKSLLESAMLTLNELDETKIRPDGFLTHEEAQSHLYFLSVTEIVNEISSATSRSFLLGDNRLHTALEKRMDLSFETYKSIAGTKDNRIETSFSLPYFSIYTIDGVVKLVFPPMDSAIPRSQFHYLVIEITNLPEFISNFNSKFAKIQSINDEWKASCSREKLEITEVMGYASGSTKRFIEWAGSKENANCIDSISLDIAGKKIAFETNSPFLFPGAVKLFVEEDSPLQGIVLKDANWKDIKSSSTLLLNALDSTDTWKLPENLNFNWAEEEFSLKKKTASCEWTSSIIHHSRLCGDPGIELDGLGLNASNFCKPEDFVLTELNAFGLKQDTKLDKSGKFIELNYIGVNDCKLAGLTLLVGAIPIPFYGSGVLVKPNSYWLVSDGKHFTGLKNLIRRNLDFLEWQQSIVIRNFTSSKSLWKGLKPEDTFLSESMNRTISSMEVHLDKFFHHPNQRSTYLQASYRTSHAMSPGEANPDSLPDASGELSEVLWAGAYKNSISISDEKFIELKTRGEGTLELEILSGTKLSRFYVPVSRLDAFTVLSKARFQCFPNARSIESDKFNLTDEVISLKLKSDGILLNEIQFNPIRGNGLNNTALKLRSSFVNSGTLGIWKTSSQPNHMTVAPECQGQTHASPESLNEFEPFLADESFDYLGTGIFYLATSYYDQNFPYSVKLYSYLPQEEVSQPLDRLGIGNLLKPVGNLLNTVGLVYQKLENYNDLKIYNRDGIFIEGVMTNPSNAQNEWILFCNRGKLTRDLADYEIQDEDSVDRIDSYFKRKNIQLPTGLNPATFAGNSTLLAPGQCGYLVDPDSSNLKLKQVGLAPTQVLTVKTTATIGNGISSEEFLDLFKYNGTQRIHIHSFGNRYSHAPFTIPVSTDEIILLSANKRGEGKYDYEVLKW